MNDTDPYCMDLVRQRDRDRYWCALLCPSAHRTALFTLYAFNSEIAEIGVSVTEPLIGHMRLRWWLDALTAIYDRNPPEHPVAQALSDVVSSKPDTRPMIERLLEARTRDMDDQPIPTTAALEAYAVGTSSTLIELSLAVMGLDTEASRRSAHHLGIAWTMTGIIRSMPHHLQQGRILLPLDLCEQHGFDRQTLLNHGYQAQPPTGLTDVVSAMTSEIKSHLERARNAWAGEGRQFISPLLVATLTDGYLAELKNAEFDPFRLNHTRIGPRVRDMIRLKGASLRGRF